jgi:hypothetical protein
MALGQPLALGQLLNGAYQARHARQPIRTGLLA